MHCVIFNSFIINNGVGTYFSFYKYIIRDKETGSKERFIYQTTFNY